MKKTLIVLIANVIVLIQFLTWGSVFSQSAFATAIPDSTVSYNNTSHKLSLGVNTTNSIEYSLTYFTGTIEQGIQGNAGAAGSFSRDLYIGTCSSTVCTPSPIVRGVIKARIPSQNWGKTIWFAINSDGTYAEKAKGNASEVSPTIDDVLFLEKGTLKQLDSQHVTPSTCIESITGDTIRARFGYTNTYGFDATLIAGNQENHFEPSPQNRSQLSLFYQGKHDSAITVDFTKSLSWVLDGTSITANSSTIRCSQVSTSLNPTPTPVGFCPDNAPWSAPQDFYASGSANTVTLNWKAPYGPVPVTYYLVSYGSTPTANEFGNPDVGGPDTTSYTVRGLSGGTYFFKIRAGNGCKPGPFSPSIKVDPSGQKIASAPAGFKEGVLGENTSTPSATATTKTVKAASTKVAEKPLVLCQNTTSWPFLLAELSALALYGLAFAKVISQTPSWKHTVFMTSFGLLAYLGFLIYNPCIEVLRMPHTTSWLSNYFILFDAAFVLAAHSILAFELKKQS